MRIASLLLLVSFLPALPRVFQDAEEEVIKEVVQAETKAFWGRDAAAWQAVWLHDANVSRTLVANGVYTSDIGWDRVSAMAGSQIKENPATSTSNSAIHPFVVRRQGNVAWAEWSQWTTRPQDPTFRSASHEGRVLVKDQGQWKIASQITYLVGTVGEAIETSVNNSGYVLLRAGKPQEAIEVLKVNVRLYPQSWNAYDSLGEAYAAAGQKDLAIQNYEKSLELNPKNETGQAALAKLKQR